MPPTPPPPPPSSPAPARKGPAAAAGLAPGLALAGAPGPASAAPRAAGGARTVHVGDGLAYLATAAFPPTHAIVTSLPDASECPALSPEAWLAFFVDAAARCCAAVAPTAVAVFYQTDVLRDGRWVDKGHLVARGAERAGLACVHHKIVCRAAPGTPTFGRPGYAHLLAFSRDLRVPPALATADVLPALGEMSWSKAMGTAACEAAVAFLLRATACRTVVDPFCGLGTVLAVANAHGLDAVGVECVRRRAARARRLRWDPATGLA